MREMPDVMKLRVGLVGLGRRLATAARPALRMLADRFEVRAVCDQVAHRAEQAAAEFDAAAVDGFRMLARREDIDAVLMLAPQWYGAAADPGGLRFGQGRLLRRRPGSRLGGGRSWSSSGSRRRASPSWPSSPAATPRPRCG